MMMANHFSIFKFFFAFSLCIVDGVFERLLSAVVLSLCTLLVAFVCVCVNYVCGNNNNVKERMATKWNDNDGPDKKQKSFKRYILKS